MKPPAESRVQFISAEELRRLSEMEREENQARTVEGFLDKMTSVEAKIDKMLEDAKQPALMEMWAMKDPGDFFRTKARLMVSQKDKGSNQQRIFIGLPMSPLDEE